MRVRHEEVNSSARESASGRGRLPFSNGSETPEYPGAAWRFTYAPEANFGETPSSYLAFFKNTAIGPEGRTNFEFKAEFFNLFNRPHFGYPDQGCCQTVINPDFGHAYGSGARLMQFGAKIAF